MTFFNRINMLRTKVSRMTKMLDLQYQLEVSRTGTKEMIMKDAEFTQGTAVLC